MDIDYRPLVVASILIRAVLTTAYSVILVALADQIALLLLGSVSNVELLYLAAIGITFTGFSVTFNSVLIGLNRMPVICLSYILSPLVGCSLSVLLVLKGWGVAGYVLG